MTKAMMNKPRWFLQGVDSWYHNIPVYFMVEFEIFDLKMVYFLNSGRVISKNDLEGQQSRNVKEVKR